MIKTNTISIATKRRESSWVDAFRPGPAQTLSAPEIGTDGGIFDDGQPQPPCSGANPVGYRDNCGGGCVHPLDNFQRANSEEDNFRFGTSSSGVLWDHLNDYAYIYNNQGEMTPELYVGSVFPGARESFPLTGLVSSWPLDITVNFTTNYGTNDTPSGISYRLLAIELMNGDTSLFEGFIDLYNVTGVGKATEYSIKDSAGSHSNLHSYPANALSTGSTIEVAFHVGFDSITLTVNGTLMISRPGIAGGTSLPTACVIRHGGGDRFNTTTFYPLIDLTLFDIDQVCDDTDPCVDKYGPGVYYDTLRKIGSYWYPQSDNVSYYNQVYFDGLPVSEGVHYWMDGLKIYPNDPEIFADTVATAEVVIL